MMDNIAATTETLGEGIIFQAEEHQTYTLASFSVSQWTRQTTDQWCDRTIVLIRATPPQKTLLVLNDFSHAGPLVVVSPYTKARINDIYEATRQCRPQSQAFVALVVGAKFLSPILNTMLPMMERGTRVKTHPFHSREDARRWLLAQITDEM